MDAVKHVKEADMRLIGEVVLVTLSLGAVGLIMNCLFKRSKVCHGSHAGKVRPPLDQVLAHPDLIRYNMQNLDSPVVTGFLFKVLVRLAYSPFGRLVFVKSMIHQSNLDRLSGEYIPDEATFYPTPPHPLADNSKANQRSLQPVVEKIMAESPTSHSGLYSCLDFYRAYESKQYTPVGVAECIISAISDSNNRSPPLRAITDSDPNVILAMAHASTERWKKGAPLSLLDGVPVAVKGKIDVAPYPFLAGAHFPSVVCEGVFEGVLVQKLREAGVVIIGIANLQEFGTGTLGSNPNKLHGTARNPHNTQCYCGGSSSGSAACVASGLCPITLGADGGGSIRIPASLCGVVGLKPTHCLLDRSGTLHVSQTVGVMGMMCSSVIDVTIVLDIFTKSGDASRQIHNLQGFGKTSLEGVRVGLYQEFFEDADQEIVTSCKRTVEKMSELGAEVVEVKIAEMEEARVAHLISIASEMAEALRVDTDKHFHEMNLETLLLLGLGSNINSTEYISAQKQRTRSVAIMKEIFKKVDMLVTPATGCVAPHITPSALSAGISDASTTGKLLRFNFLANLTGIPGITLPVTLDQDNLPISIQLMAPWHEEGLLLQVAYALEKVGFAAKRPADCFYDVLH